MVHFIPSCGICNDRCMELCPFDGTWKRLKSIPPDEEQFTNTDTEAAL